MRLRRMTECSLDAFDAIVVGTGFAGAVAAQQLADTAGKKVLMIEKRSQIGGNMYDGKNAFGVDVHWYGPHLFHTNQKDVYDYLSRFTGWYDYRHKVVGAVNGKLVPIPFNFLSMDILFDDKTAEIYKTKLQRFFPDAAKASVMDLVNHEDADIRDIGHFVYENVFVNYTSKQWGIHPDNIDKSVINRVPVVFGYEDGYFSDAYQCMPQDGYMPIFNNMLKNDNITVALNEDATDYIRIDENAVTIMGVHTDMPIVYTGMIDALLNYRYGALPYRSLNMVFEDHPVDQYQPNSVVNYPNEHDYTRITEFKHFTKQQIDGKTTILKEYPKSYDHTETGAEPYYPINNDDNDALYSKYKKVLKSQSNVYLCGRLADYKYYNMDAVVSKALEVSKTIINDLQ